MINLEHLQLEIKGIALSADEVSIYIAEYGLLYIDHNIPTDEANTRKIYESALAILESIANGSNYSD